MTNILERIFWRMEVLRGSERGGGDGGGVDEDDEGLDGICVVFERVRWISIFGPEGV